ncbi:MAG: efflux RND transporter permease subunit [Planctomycetes bacterium]|nr:efflux RND transporter permease subunit [Planctomycetota bacterium]
MKIADLSIKYPVSTLVGVTFVVLFGVLSLLSIPVQLTPTVDRPRITVRTGWYGASPQEVEREIVDEQEEVLKSVQGLVKMDSESYTGRAEVILEFQIGTHIEDAARRVSNKLDQVKEYPIDADKPVISTSSARANAIAWFMLRTTNDNPRPINTYYEFADDWVKPVLERVRGVADVNIYGGREEEMQVIIDPGRLAARSLTLQQVADALRLENKNISAGSYDLGKRRYAVRTMGEYNSPEDIENVIIARVDGVPVYVRDVAEVKLGYKRADFTVFQNGKPGMAINAVKEPDANVLDTMADLREAVKEINRSVLKGRGLEFVQVYDQTTYIYDAIDLVKNNILLGGALAVIVLLLFLRSPSSTLIIAAAIPISVVGTFLMLALLGRNINVISLAGMAFAVGMMVDNSIVVLENIYRHRQMGKGRFQAASEATSEVWGAVLASTLTTVAVFLPILFIKEEAGQLFRDIAVAISSGVALSLIVAITVIPMLCARFLRVKGEKQIAEAQHKIDPHAPYRGAGLTVRGIGAVVYWLTGRSYRAFVVVVAATVVSIYVSWRVMPPLEYLPEGNRNLLMALIIPPPGYNIKKFNRIGEIIGKVLLPLCDLKPGTPEAEKAPGGGIQNYFYVGRNPLSFAGVVANDPMRVRELIPVLKRPLSTIPGAMFVVIQRSLFDTDIGEGRNIDVDLKGPDVQRLIELGGQVLGKAVQLLPGGQFRPIPSLDYSSPEVHIIPDRRRLADAGLTNRELGFAVNALIDGAYVTDYRRQGNKIDLVLMGPEHRADTLEQVKSLPISTPNLKNVTLGSLADVRFLSGPTQINHSERQRTITIQITPPRTVVLEDAIHKVEKGILKPMEKNGELGGLYTAQLSGTADKLTTARKALTGNFILALLVSYLLMASLFENFLHPFVILFSVPLAMLGGFLGLAATNRFLGMQMLDVLTMLGFIILIGVVVNNAILIVHQSLNHMRDDGMAYREAIREAVRNRVRPIFMSTTTSVFGMLPLVLMPGAGSELYRGLGSVVVGGLALSTVFTLFVVPSVFALVLRAQGLFHRSHPEPEEAEPESDANVETALPIDRAR